MILSFTDWLSIQKKTINVRQWLPITLILLLASVLMFYRLGTEGLWTDEFISVGDVTEGKLWRLEKNLPRPLYYALLTVWMWFGSGDVWLRSLSVIFGIASVFLLYQLGRRLAGEAEGLIAAFDVGALSHIY